MNLNIEYEWRLTCNQKSVLICLDIQGSLVTKYTICKTEDYCSWDVAGTVPGNKVGARCTNCTKLGCTPCVR